MFKFLSCQSDQVTLFSFEVNVCKERLLIFSFILLALILAPSPPDGPVIIGAVSSIFEILTVTIWSDLFPAESVPLTITSYELLAPLSFGFS